MDIDEKLNKGKFWLSGNAHKVYAVTAGGKRASKVMFACKLGEVLVRYECQIDCVNPAIIVVDVSHCLMTLGRRGYEAFLQELRDAVKPTTTEGWGTGKIKLWWD